MSAKRIPKLGWSNNVTSTSFEISTVYDLVDVIRKKPGLFVGEPSLTGLWHFINGFTSALCSIENPLEAEQPPFRDFHRWIATRFNLEGVARSWKDLLLEAIGNEESAFDRFFVELDAYRASRSEP